MPPIEETPDVQAKLDRLRQLRAALEAERQQEAQEEDRQFRERVALARKDCRIFAQYVIKDERTNSPIKLAALHFQWFDHIDYCWSRGLHAFILAPWGHGKTTLLSETIPLFCFGQNPGLRIKMVSANDDIAMKRVNKIRGIIADDEDYHTVFPNVRPAAKEQWTSHTLYLQRHARARDPSLEAKGIGTTVVGGRADILIVDDVNDQKNTISQPKLRKVVWDNYKFFVSRLDPDGRLMAVATRWHDEDIPGLIMATEPMRTRYGFLVQRINEDLSGIDCEFYYGTEIGRPHIQSRLDKYFAEAKEEAERVYGQTSKA